MTFLIAGAGAIGGYIGARMARAGQDVTLFARGPHLAAMQERGLRILSADGDFEVRPKLIGTLENAGPFDVIFLGVKAHGLTALAPQIAPADRRKHDRRQHAERDSMVVFRRSSRSNASTPAASSRAPSRSGHVVASLVYLGTDIVEPGVIRHDEGNRISLGEPGGTRSDRCRAIADALIQSGLRCPITARIRHEIWVKILGNVAFNPISALTGATLAGMVRDPGVNGVVRNIMTEVEAVAAKLGIELPISIDQRIAGAEKVGEHKTSMLQDLEAGRPMELEAVIGAVVEIGERVGVAMPHTKTVYACTKLLDITKRAAS